MRTKSHHLCNLSNPPLLSLSLSQWLAHQKTCPQCRERCLPRNVIKLFIDTGEQHSRNSDNTTLDPREVAVRERERERLGRLFLNHRFNYYTAENVRTNCSTGLCNKWRLKSNTNEAMEVGRKSLINCTGLGSHI